MQLVALDHLHRGLDPLHHAVGKGFARVTAVDKHALDRLQIRLAPVDGGQRAVAVGHIGRGHGDGMGQSLRVHRDMPLDAAHLFASVVALQLRTVGVLHALRINDQEAGRGVATQFLAGLANGFFLRLAPERWFRPDRACSTWRSTRRP